MVREFANGVAWVRGTYDPTGPVGTPGHGGGVDAVLREEREDVALLESPFGAQAGTELDGCLF